MGTTRGGLLNYVWGNACNWSDVEGPTRKRETLEIKGERADLREREYQREEVEPKKYQGAAGSNGVKGSRLRGCGARGALQWVV